MKACGNGGIAPLFFNLDDMMCGQFHVPAALLPLEIPVSTEYKARWVSDQDWKFRTN
jgi:hypothetical protein